jgi:hypothetical protein
MRLGCPPHPARAVCNNESSRKSCGTMLNAGTTAGKRAIVWLILAALAALVTYLAFRGYFSPELLLNFSNTFNC